MTDLNYQIALTNVQFDNSYRNVLRFDNRSEQEAYFNVNTLFSNSPEVNFNVGSFHATNVIYDCKDNASINELLNKNYCIIKDNTTNKNLNYFYYFVSNAKQECDNRISLSLELDVMQTFYIDMQFTECMINKAHLNRFIDNGDGTVSFDGRPQSKLFEREDIQNVAKRLTKRTKVGNKNFEDITLNNWFENNIYGWLYLFIQPDHNYNIRTIDGQSRTTLFAQATYLNKELEGEYGNALPAVLDVLAVPVYKRGTATAGQGNRIKIKSEIESIPILTIRTEALSSFMNANNDASYVYSYKFSTISPFNENYIDTYEIDSNNNLILKNWVTEPEHAYSWGSPNGQQLTAYCMSSLSGFFNVRIIYSEMKSLNYTVSKDFTFNKNDIVGKNKNSKFNPKLLSTDYFELSISDNTENGFIYDLQKLNLKNFNLIKTDPAVPDTQKTYIRIETDNNNVYIEDTAENLTGFVNTNDNSIVLATEAYQAMLANNKNFYMQNLTNRNIDYTKGLIASGAGIITGLLTGNPIAVAGGVMAGVGTGINYAKSKITENLTVDNLKNSPENISQAKGNIYFEAMYSKVGIIVEEYDILENEKEMINDYMCQYGFTYNRLDNIKNVDNIRKYYNYVRADIQEINSNTVNISHVIHDKFLEIFRNGVRFWNTDNFSYQKENYERWLENG